MKKLFVALISTVLCFSLFAFVGCDKDEYHDYTVDLSKMEVGAAIPIYPECEFNYVLTPENELHPEIAGEYTFHVVALSAKLLSKNSIHEGDTLTEQFYPFEIQIDISGSVSPDLAGYTFSAKVCCQTSFIDIASIDFVVSQSGEFEGSVTFGVYDAEPAPLYFAHISKFFW